MATLALKNLEATKLLGAFLAHQILAGLRIPILLRGELGCGKTTLASALTAALPGGSEAEVSSPSFTIYNRYPTRPAIIHCDLYRCQTYFPEEIYDFLESPDSQIIVEWAEYLTPYPKEYLDIYFNLINASRILNITGGGQPGKELEQQLRLNFKQD